MTWPPLVYRAMPMVTAVMLVASAGAAVQQPAAPETAGNTPLVVGVVRGDGVMLPIALLQEDGWTEARAHDPAVQRGLLRIRDRDLLPRTPWTLYSPADAPRTLSLGQEVTVDAYCERQEGVATDARPGPGAVAAPHLTWAVATSRPLTAVAPQDVLNDPDDASRRVMVFVTTLTDALEAERSVVPRSRLAGITPAERARVAPQVTVLLRDQQFVDGQAYYFEAQKPYPGVMLFAAGWITSASSRLSLVHVSGGIDAGGESVRPVSRILGVLRMGPDTVWVLERQYYEGTAYELVSTGFRPRMLSASGGGC